MMTSQMNLGNMPTGRHFQASYIAIVCVTNVCGMFCITTQIMVLDKHEFKDLQV